MVNAGIAIRSIGILCSESVWNIGFRYSGVNVTPVRVLGEFFRLLAERFPLLRKFPYKARSQVGRDETSNQICVGIGCGVSDLDHRGIRDSVHDAAARSG